LGNEIIAVASAVFTTVSERVSSWERKKVTASAATRNVELALMKDSTVFCFVIPGFA
jgi:tRNA U34 2-thiouridine synthase MnmA/TrmU